MTDALERLKSRLRPTIPTRDASLAPGINPETLKSSIPSAQTPTLPGTQKSNSQENNQPLQTKQSTLRLEIAASERLQELCRKNGICREVLIEAMLEYCESHSGLLQDILSAAKNKNEHRQQVANRKRAKSMMQRFSDIR